MICSETKLGNIENIDKPDGTAIMTDIEHNDMCNVNSMEYDLTRSQVIMT